MTKHEKAKAAFWAIVNKKAEENPLDITDAQKLTEMIDYMLDRLPTWAVDKATGWMKDYEPNGS